MNTIAPELAGLLEALAVSPADDGLRRIMSDYLSECGEPELASLLQIQIALNPELGAEKSGRGWWRLPNGAELRRRERELLTIGRRRQWCSWLVPRLVKPRRLTERTLTFERGLPDSFYVWTASQLNTLVSSIGRKPIVTLSLAMESCSARSARNVRALARWADRLSIYDRRCAAEIDWGTVHRLRQLLAPEATESLFCALGDPAMFPNLEALGVWSAPDGPLNQSWASARDAVVQRLTRLEIGEADLLFRSPPLLQRLKSLHVDLADPDLSRVHEIVIRAPEIEELAIEAEESRASSFERRLLFNAIAKCPKLKRLRLSGMALDADDVGQLVPCFDKLIELELSVCTWAGLGAIEALAGARLENVLRLWITRSPGERVLWDPDVAVRRRISASAPNIRSVCLQGPASTMLDLAESLPSVVQLGAPNTSESFVDRLWERKRLFDRAVELVGLCGWDRQRLPRPLRAMAVTRSET